MVTGAIVMTSTVAETRSAPLREAPAHRDMIPIPILAEASGGRREGLLHPGEPTWREEDEF